MHNTGLKVLGLIGARSGSKGIPHKNIKPLGGKPLMGWIIDAALKSKYVNRVVVSTDSSKYADIARGLGAEAPFLRPKDIANEISTDQEYILYTLDRLEKEEGYVPDIVLRLLPTVPLQIAGDLDACVSLLIDDPDAHASVVVAKARQHPHKALKLISDGKGGRHIVPYISGNSREGTPVARQNYEGAYFRANVVATRINTIRSLNSLTGDRVRYHVIPQERAIDIDDPIDFFIAEQLIHKLQLS